MSLIFTNGCFDILHAGHIDLLLKAKYLDDPERTGKNTLVVGLNSDWSIGKLKGEGRPIMDQMTRWLILASLKMVDKVHLFEETTPLQLIHEIKPDVIVKGDDYFDKEVIGGDFVKARGGRVVIVKRKVEESTTRIIRRAKAAP